MGFFRVSEAPRDGVKEWHERVSGDGKKATNHSDARRSRAPEEGGDSKAAHGLRDLLCRFVDRPRILRCGRLPEGQGAVA